MFLKPYVRISTTILSVPYPESEQITFRTLKAEFNNYDVGFPVVQKGQGFCDIICVNNENIIVFECDFIDFVMVSIDNMTITIWTIDKWLWTVAKRPLLVWDVHYDSFCAFNGFFGLYNMMSKYAAGLIH